MVLVLCGRKGSGKTRLCIDILTSPNGLCSVYDKVFCISPTFDRQPIWRERISGEGWTIYKALDNETLEKVFNQLLSKPQSEKVLLLLDDNGEDLRRVDQKIVNKLVSNSRHLNCSIVLLLQKMTQCPTCVRCQTDTFVCFSATSQREIDALWAEVGKGSKQEFHQMFHSATEGRYAHMVCSISQQGKITYNSCFRDSLA